MTIPGLHKFTHFPRHIAIIMDGNRRWAEQRGLPNIEGHRAGTESLRSVVDCLGNYRLPYLTIYGFSTENWHRAPDEVQELFGLVEEVLLSEMETLHKYGIRINHLGRLVELPTSVQQAIKKTVALTQNNRNMVLSFAFNYGGRAEITDAVRRIVSEGIAPQNIDEELFNRYLYTEGLPDVDLVIRTGGETRLSNFLTWQTVYSEIYFTDVLWPDFNAEEIDKALQFYNRKQRRFGGD
jgi:undecaprenyl diphosphate synthase